MFDKSDIQLLKKAKVKHLAYTSIKLVKSVSKDKQIWNLDFEPIPMNEIKAYLRKSKSLEEMEYRVEVFKGLEWKGKTETWLEYFGVEVKGSRKERQ